MNIWLDFELRHRKAIRNETKEEKKKNTFYDLNQFMGGD